MVAVLKKLDTLREEKLTNYVAISVDSNIEQIPTSFTAIRPEWYFTLNDNLVSSIWRRSEDRFHSMGYFPKEKGAILSLENIPKVVQDAADTLVAVSSDIYKSNRIHNYKLLNGKVVRNARSGEVESYGDEIFLEQICWPRIVVPSPIYFPTKWKNEVVTGSNGESLIMIERTMKVRDRGKEAVQRWYLDPARDHICVRNEVVSKTYEECFEILECAQASNGHYYPKVIRKKKTKINGSERIITEELTRHIYIQIDPEYPEGLFDPKNLPK